MIASIGVGTAYAAPPSEPDVRISRIGLSGRRFYLMRTGISMTDTRKARVRICLTGVAPGVLASSASRFHGSRHSPSESFQHARTGCRAAPNQDFHRLSPLRHSRGWKPPMHAVPTSAFLHPFAPRALPRFPATTGTLTPARLALRTHTRGNEHQPFTGQVSLVHTTQPSTHSVSNHLTRTIIAFPLPAQRDGPSGFRTDGSALADSGSGLRLYLGSSSLRPAESSSSSYGLHVRLRLLPTPPHGDAVSFGYRERASPGRGLPPLRSRLLPGALGRVSIPDTMAKRLSGLESLPAY